MSNSINFKTKYTKTTSTRQYEIDNVEDTDAQVETVRTKVNAINASLAGGQASTLANLFVADDYDNQEQIGLLENIYDVKIKTVIETPIPQTPTFGINYNNLPEDFNDDTQDNNQPEDFNDDTNKEEADKI